VCRATLPRLLILTLPLHWPFFAHARVHAAIGQEAGFASSSSQRKPLNRAQASVLFGGLNVMRQRLGHTQRGHRTCRLCWIIRERSEKVLLADASKWERPSIIRFAEWNEIDDWITDKPLTVKETKKLRSFGLSLHVSRGWKHL
jgi:DeoR/GlpR family transcriptional regulator of sugar metabolism